MEGQGAKFYHHSVTITIEMPNLGRAFKYVEKLEFELSTQHLMADILFFHRFQLEKKAESLKNKLQQELPVLKN